MRYKIIFKIAFYLGIISSVILLWLSISLDVKFGMDNSSKEALLETGERLTFTSDLYLIIISICTFGLIILEMFRKKQN